MKKRKSKITATVAPGIDDDKELYEKATEKEIEKGEYTPVSILSTHELDTEE